MDEPIDSLSDSLRPADAELEQSDIGQPRSEDTAVVGCRQQDTDAYLVTYGRNCVIAERVRIGHHTRVGNFVFIRDDTIIGRHCTIGSFVDIEGDVHVGDFVSLQSGCYLTRGVLIEDKVFCGPRIVTLNDKQMCYGRASMKFVREAPRILRAARVGGGSVLCPGITIGENAFVGAGSVVTCDVPDRMMAMGNPAKIVGPVREDQIV